MIDICSCLSSPVGFMVESLAQWRLSLHLEAKAGSRVLQWGEYLLQQKAHLLLLHDRMCVLYSQDSSLVMQLIASAGNLFVLFGTCRQERLYKCITFNLLCWAREINLFTLTSESHIFCQHPWNGGRLTRHAAGRMKCPTLHSSWLWSIIAKITFAFSKLIHDKMF